MKHIVVGIINRRRPNGEDEYLLVKSKKDFGEFTGYWYPPGGHLEEGEGEKNTIIREIKEELNLQIEPIRKLAETPGDVKDQNTHWWVCNLLSDKMEIDNTEIAEVGWFTREDMKTMQLWPATRDFFEKYVFSPAEYR